MGNNLQYRRTHKAIIGAFLKLCREKSFDRVTVQDIMEEALVSRYTFYKHFKDKHEIAELLQEQMLADFRQITAQVRRESQSGTMDQADQNALWCRFAVEHQEFQVLWNIHTETVDLQARFRELFHDMYLQELLKSGYSPYRELEAEICAAVQATLMNFFASETNLSTGNLGEPIRDVIINSCLHLARLESPEKAKAALKPYI